jgi:hypothetical protein
MAFGLGAIASGALTRTLLSTGAGVCVGKEAVVCRATGGRRADGDATLVMPR